MWVRDPGFVLSGKWERPIHFISRRFCMSMESTLGFPEATFFLAAAALALAFAAAVLEGMAMTWPDPSKVRTMCLTVTGFLWLSVGRYDASAVVVATSA